MTVYGDSSCAFWRQSYQFVCQTLITSCLFPTVSLFMYSVPSAWNTLHSLGPLTNLHWSLQLLQIYCFLREIISVSPVPPNCAISGAFSNQLCRESMRSLKHRPNCGIWGQIIQISVIQLLLHVFSIHLFSTCYVTALLWEPVNKNQKPLRMAFKFCKGFRWKQTNKPKQNAKCSDFW